MHCSEELTLTGKLITIAQRQALIAVFLLPTAGTAPVVEASTDTPPEPTSQAQQVAAESNKVKGGVAKVTTADQLETASPTQKAAANQAMKEWRDEIANLDPKQPGQWDQHLTKIGSLPMLKEYNRVELMNELIQAGYQVYVDYNSETQKFKLAPVQEVAVA